MLVLVCGGRDYGDVVTKGKLPEKVEEYRNVFRVLDSFAVENSIYFLPVDNWLPSDIEIISGMARGADSVAVDWAVVNWCKVHEYPARWKEYGKRAGILRNKQMLEEGKPDVVIAFPGGKGTANMIKIAEEAGVRVVRVT